MKRLADKYRNRDVAFVIVYVREAHPEERGYRGFVQPEDFDQKLAYARVLVGTEELGCPVVVDGMDEAVHRWYGRLPNMVYVIDKAGTVVYKATWTLPEEIDQVLAALTGARLVPSPSGRCRKARCRRTLRRSNATTSGGTSFQAPAG